MTQKITLPRPDSARFCHSFVLSAAHVRRNFSYIEKGSRLRIWIYHSHNRRGSKVNGTEINCWKILNNHHYLVIQHDVQSIHGCLQAAAMILWQSVINTIERPLTNCCCTSTKTPVTDELNTIQILSTFRQSMISVLIVPQLDSTMWEVGWNIYFNSQCLTETDHFKKANFIITAWCNIHL